MSSGPYHLEQLIALHQQGRIQEAEQGYQALLGAEPQLAPAWHFLGLLYAQTDRLDDAVPCLEKAVGLAPQDALFHCNLGEAHRRRGDAERAVASYQSAVALAPDMAPAHFNMGVAYKQNGRLPEAIACWKRVIQLTPNMAKAHFNLGNALHELGRPRSAVSAYRQALTLDPQYVDALINLGRTLDELDEWSEASAMHRAALRCAPQRTAVFGNLAGSLLQQGKFDEAVDAYRDWQARSPSWLNEFRLATIQPSMFDSNSAIDAARDQLVQALERFRTERPPTPTTVPTNELHSSAIEPSMDWAYQGRDELPVKRRYEQLFRPLFADEPGKQLPGSGGRPQIGFVVTHNHEGVFAKCMRGLIRNLSGAQFQITVVCSPARRDYLQQMIASDLVHYLPISDRVDEAAAQIANARFDVLLYWEIGTDSTNYFLPFYRLAPVQCTTFGWPVTSGIATVDFFLSSKQLETADSPQFYSERLVQFTALPTFYYRPQLEPGRKTREDFGLPTASHVYFCGQRLRKMQPDFDLLLKELLQADEQGTVVLIGDRQPYRAERLKRRMHQAMPEVIDRVQILPWMSEQDYLSLTAVADVTLDTLHYGGGANTIYDAVAMGQPVVTRAGPFQRSRYATAVFRQMELDALVADSNRQYVQIAVQLATDRDYRASVVRQMAEADGALFEDRTIVDEYRQFFLEVVQ